MGTFHFWLNYPFKQIIFWVGTQLLTDTQDTLYYILHFKTAQPQYISAHSKTTTKPVWIYSLIKSGVCNTKFLFGHYNNMIIFEVPCKYQGV